MSFLASRTPRERWLIICAATLLCAFLIWQVGVQPVLSQKTQAQLAHKMALRDLDIVQRGLPQIHSTQGPAKASFTRTEMISAARQANVAITRVQPAANEAFQVWFEDAETTRIYDLLADLSARFDVSIDRVQITRRETGRVSAQVTIAAR